MLKRDELKYSHSCLNKAAMDEPLFVLRANDPISAKVIHYWCQLAVGIHEPMKIESARQDAQIHHDYWISKHPSQTSGKPKG